MAKVVATRKSRKAKADVKKDLEVLARPDCTATIAARSVTCREYGFIEELRLWPLIEPLAKEFAALMESGQDNNKWEEKALFARYLDSVEQLIAASAKVDLDWVRGLNRNDGEKLMHLWWDATGPFFIGCAMNYLHSQGRLNQLMMKAVGQISTQPSSPTDTPSQQ